jgi:hypothetical protein
MLPTRQWGHCTTPYYTKPNRSLNTCFRSFPVWGKHWTPTGCVWSSRIRSIYNNFTTNAHAEVFLPFLQPYFHWVELSSLFIALSFHFSGSSPPGSESSLVFFASNRPWAALYPFVFLRNILHLYSKSAPWEILFGTNILATCPSQLPSVSYPSKLMSQWNRALITSRYRMG